MRISSAVVAVFSSICLSTASFAATVNATSGQVLVNKGEGYRQVAGSTQANPGASVVANPGGSGQIVYSDQCIVEVLPGSVYVVAEQSPCVTGLLSPGTFAIGAVVVGGGVAAYLLLGNKDKGPSP
jgi:hypothetical protein